METVNIGIVAHVDAGKTTLTEQLLFRAGATRKIGSVDEGTARTDFLEVERSRGISVKASSASLTHNGKQINIIDTPGHVDFIGEVERALSVLDTAVLVVSAVEGIQAQTEILFEALRKTHTNIIVFINKIDRIGSNSKAVLSQLRGEFSKNILAFNEIVGEQENEAEVVSRVIFYEEATELLAELDENIMEAYLSDNQIEKTALERAVSQQFNSGNLIPVFFGSSKYGRGIGELLDFIARYAEPVKNNADDRLSGVVYKITHDKEMGRIAHLRMFGGTLKNRDLVKLGENSEKITQIRKYSGLQYTDVGVASRGDIVAVCGLSLAKVSDIIGEAHELLGVKMTVPLLKVSAIPEKAEQLFAVMRAFDELSAEDPLLGTEYNEHEHELNICITGMIQLEILSAIIRERYGLSVSFSAPTVIYKETPTTRARGFDAYTMPKPCWAVIELDIEPGERGTGLSYSSVVKNDKIFYRYQNHIETAVPRALKQGLYNWEVTDLRVTLIGGEHHTIHTHPLDFFLATPLAVMDGLRNAGTTLLEPLQTVRLSAAEEFTGKIIGDIIAMRGEFDSPVISNGITTVEATIPVSSSLDYPVKFASMTSGRGVYSSRFSQYKPCPLELGATAKRIGVNPLDRDKWILNQRNALK